MDVLDLAIQPDHLHLFVSASPDWAPNQIAHRLRGIRPACCARSFPLCSRCRACGPNAACNIKDEGLRILAVGHTESENACGPRVRLPMEATLDEARSLAL